MELGDLLNRHFTIPETKTRHFGPTLAEQRKLALKALKPQPDYSINRKRRPVAGDDKQPTQESPQL